MGKPILLVEALATRNDSGLGKHVRMFVDALRGLASDADIRVLLPRDGNYRPGDHCRTLFVHPKPWRLWTQTVFPWIILQNKPALVFCMGQTLPLLRPSARYALLIPDAGPLENSGLTMSSHDDYNRRWLKRMAPKADGILTSTAFTREKLTLHLGIPERIIRVVRPIAKAEEKPHAKGTGRAPSQGPLGAPGGDYFLSIGNVEPRKNYPGLLEAYADLRRRRSDAPPLYIVGHKAWGFAEAEAAMLRLGLGNWVRFTGYIPASQLQAYLEGCTAYISSSLYEGWGLPLFEALALGKSALYHRDSCQDEFARGMALAVDCADRGRLSAGLEKLLDPEERRKCRETLRAGFRAVQSYDLESELRSALLPLLHEA